MSRSEIRSWLMDMDGVLVHEQRAVPGADRFLARLRETATPFLVLTNNSIYTRRDLSARLRASGLEVPEESITNPDPTGPSPDGPLPATGSVAALISHATGVQPYFVGKPNPLMMRSALNAIDAHSGPRR
jgi:ribonucleotide monophosphatase NagD (HAD superfamily)